MEGSEEVSRIKADVASSKSALEKLQADYRAQQLKILELDGVKQQISGLKEDADIQN
jgi:prefoldin subunit 5